MTKKLLVVVPIIFALVAVGCATKADVKLAQDYSKRAAEASEQNLTVSKSIESTVKSIDAQLKDMHKKMMEHMKKGMATKKEMLAILKDLQQRVHANVKVYGTVVNCSYLTIRKGPSVDTEPVGYLKKGDKIEVLEISGAWARCKRGYVSLHYLSLEFTTE